jgi:vitamin B12 transporter
MIRPRRAGAINFGPLLVGNIERIEVVRGSQSVVWGSQAIGGVVNMITKAPTDELVVNGQGEAGWRNSVQLGGNASGRFGPVAPAWVPAGFAPTAFLPSAKCAAAQERDGFENVSANARFDIRLSEALSLDLRGNFQDGTTELDGFAPPSFQFGDTLEVSDTRQFVGYAGLNAVLLEGRFRTASPTR